VTALAPMRPEQFVLFRAEVTAAYADDNVHALRWLEAGAAERARSEFDKLLPQGVSTTDHWLYEILDEPDGQTVGFVWFAVVGPAALRTGFLYNIRVSASYRGRGHAKAAMELVEAKAVELGVPAIALHVFGFNTTAQAMYRALGYGITGFNMIKRLDVQPPPKR
jgi:ribosomal protein S18 acetylase RimI-like enzyme